MRSTLEMAPLFTRVLNDSKGLDLSFAEKISQPIGAAGQKRDRRRAIGEGGAKGCVRMLPNCHRF